MKYYVLLIAVGVMATQIVSAEVTPIGVSSPAPMPPVLKYDCYIINLTPDGAKLKFYEHKKVVLTDGAKVILHKHGGLTYELAAYSLKGGPMQGTGTLEAWISKDGVASSKGIVADASVGFSSAAPDSISTYGWHTRVISCAKDPR